MKADKDILQAKLQIINKRLQFLRKEKNSFDSSSSEKDVLAVKHALQEMIEACLDIANHIISSENAGEAKTYASYFDKLHNISIIDKNLKHNLRRMAKFRNVLVHLYADIEISQVKEILNSNLQDIDEYASCIYTYLEE